jgi:5'-3' exonuclease
MLKKYKIILWDFDGVIMDSNAVRDLGFERVLADYPKDSVAELMKFHHQNGGLSRYVKFRYFFEKVLKEEITEEKIQERFGVLTENFILFKTLVGDNSDKIPGVKGMGEGKLLKFFPELAEQELTLEDIFSISETKLKENKMYAKVLHSFDDVRNFHRLMDLKNPLIDDNEKTYIIDTINEDIPKLNTKEFLQLSHEDNLAIILKGIELWLKDTFRILNSVKK